MSQPIIISNWEQGIARSPREGFADMRNIEIDSNSGFVEIGFKTVKGTATVEEVKWFAQNSDTPAQFFALDGFGNFYRSNDSGLNWSHISDRGGFGEGMVYWKDYVLVTENTIMSAYGPLSGTPAFTTVLGSSFDSLTSFKPALVGQDDIVYIGNDYKIATLQEKAGTAFVPDNSDTFTFQSNALDLPTGFRIKTLDELGTDLLIGAGKGNAGASQAKIGDIFPWDRISDSFNLPLRFGESGIHAIKTIDNVVYIAAGQGGEIFATNKSSIVNIFQVPKHITSITGLRWIDVNPQSIIRHGSRILFGIKSPGSSGQEVLDGIAVWAFDLETGALTMLNQISTGSTGRAAPGTKITALHPINRNQYLIAWADGSNYGIDYIHATDRYTDYAARIDSQYYTVATPRKPAEFSQVEFELSEPLATGNGIRFSYRKNLNDSFTVIRTFDYATDGAIQGGLADFTETTNHGIQFRIEMTTGANSSTTPKLNSVIVR